LNDNGQPMPKRKPATGRDASTKEIREAERILALTAEQQRSHPTAVPADRSRLAHINTYGTLPDFYLDQPFVCRQCGKTEIWKARDQKWYYEEAKGHIDAKAVECHDCRMAKKTH
jgi:hypothetical protein